MTSTTDIGGGATTTTTTTGSEDEGSLGDLVVRLRDRLRAMDSAAPGDLVAWEQDGLLRAVSESDLGECFQRLRAMMPLLVLRPAAAAADCNGGLSAAAVRAGLVSLISLSKRNHAHWSEQPSVKRHLDQIVDRILARPPPSAVELVAACPPGTPQFVRRALVAHMSKVRWNTPSGWQDLGRAWTVFKWHGPDTSPDYHMRCCFLWDRLRTLVRRDRTRDHGGGGDLHPPKAQFCLLRKLPSEDPAAAAAAAGEFVPVPLFHGKPRGEDANERGPADGDADVVVPLDYHRLLPRLPLTHPSAGASVQGCRGVYCAVLRAVDAPERASWQTYVGKATPDIAHRWLASTATSHFSAVCACIDAALEGQAVRPRNALLVDLEIAALWCTFGTLRGHLFVFAVEDVGGGEKAAAAGGGGGNGAAAAAPSGSNDATSERDTAAADRLLREAEKRIIHQLESTDMSRGLNAH